MFILSLTPYRIIAIPLTILTGLSSLMPFASAVVEELWWVERAFEREVLGGEVSTYSEPLLQPAG
jgi:hypothetical protein